MVGRWISFWNGPCFWVYMLISGKFNIYRYLCKKVSPFNFAYFRSPCQIPGKKKKSLKKTQHFFPCHQELSSKTNPLFTITYTLPPQKCPPSIHPENDRPQTREQEPRDLPVLVTKSPRFDPSSSKIQHVLATKEFFGRLCIKCLEGLITKGLSFSWRPFLKAYEQLREDCYSPWKIVKKVNNKMGPYQPKKWSEMGPPLKSLKINGVHPSKWSSGPL